ncbi:MAG: mechanosensitive ion channel [Pseudomonadales bacterium]|nr:mechanosensitive ion channel [Pseudomonadales bacterium]MDP6471940.1 mechanosensitive ion channel [Pseudomonadales bacterium]MDP6970932.1 mechanosensitive ion channel [Pseudomonadales bacterium]
MTYTWAMISLDSLLQWGAPAVITLLGATLLVWILTRTFANTPNASIYRQLAIVMTILIAMIVLVVALPLPSELTGQLISLFGLVITAVIALASTTFVSNVMAGLMLRAVSSFAHGDFIRVGEHFGRVTEKALLHTEIQSEDRDLVTLPNLYLMAQPVKVVRSSGTIVSADVSLGYDVNRTRATQALKRAAASCELGDPFVQITELGDTSVGYRVSGFLEDVRNLVSKRTQLRGRVLDALHKAGVEIVSPAFMNQRQIPTDVSFIPEASATAQDDPADLERIMFDKADLVARLADLRAQRDALRVELDQLEQNGEDTPQAEAMWRTHHLATLQSLIDTLKLGID